MILKQPGLAGSLEISQDSPAIPSTGMLSLYPAGAGREETLHLLVLGMLRRYGDCL